MQGIRQQTREKSQMKKTLLAKLALLLLIVSTLSGCLWFVEEDGYGRGGGGGGGHHDHGEHRGERH
jgi:hypothetical protein